MAFGFKLFKGHKLQARNLMSPFISRKQFKRLRSKLGLTSKNKLVRSLRRNLLGKAVAPSMPSSATTYQHQARSLSQLTGGV